MKKCWHSSVEFDELLVRRKSHMLRTSEVRSSVCKLGTFFFLFYATVKWNHLFRQDFTPKRQERSKTRA